MPSNVKRSKRQGINKFETQMVKCWNKEYFENTSFEGVFCFLSRHAGLVKFTCVS